MCEPATRIAKPASKPFFGEQDAWTVQPEAAVEALARALDD